MPGIHVKFSVDSGSMDARKATDVIERLEEILGRHPGESGVRFIAEPGDESPLVLPREALLLLAHVPTQVTRGPNVLRVSRPYLSRLDPLPAGGRHRRVVTEDLMEYAHRLWPESNRPSPGNGTERP